MNILPWVLQGLTAAIFGASGVAKFFIFDRVGEGVQAFGAVPLKAWRRLSLLMAFIAYGRAVLRPIR